MNPNDHCAFRKSVRVGDAGELDDSYSDTHYGALRYNLVSNRFEGLHKLHGGADIFGNVWRELGVDVASSEKVGGIRVGENLMINPATGVLSAVGNSPSRINQRIITISPITGISDFHDIQTAISSTIGTFPDWNDGSLTQKYGVPADSNIYILQLTPGIFEIQEDILELPDFIHLRGDSKQTTIFKTRSLIAGDSSIISNISLIGDIEAHFKDNIIIENVAITGNILLESGQNHIVQNTSIYSGHLHCIQTHLNLENLLIESSINKSKSSAIILDDCVPINIKDCIRINNVRICNYNVGIRCNMTMFNARDMISEDVNIGCEFGRLCTTPDSSIVEGLFILKHENPTILYYKEDDGKNLIRKGFMIKTKISITLPDGSKVFRHIKHLELLVIKLDKPIKFDWMNHDLISVSVKQLMYVSLDNCNIGELKSDGNDCDYDIYVKNINIISNSNNCIDIGFNCLKLDDGNSYIIGKHFITLSKALNYISADETSTDFFVIRLVNNYIIEEPNDIKLCKNLNIVCNMGERGIIRLKLNVHIYLESNNKFENIEFDTCILILNHLVNCEFIKCKFTNSFIKCNASQLKMSNCVIHNTIDESNGELEAPLFISNDGNDGNGCNINKIILRNVDIKVNFKELSPIVGGYCIDSTSSNKSEDYGSMDDIFIAIGCIFNREIYLNSKIKSNIMACVID